MVKWTSHAKRQLRHIHDYIAQGSPVYARRVSIELAAAVLDLSYTYPRQGEYRHQNRRPEPHSHAGLADTWRSAERTVESPTNTLARSTA